MTDGANPKSRPTAAGDVSPDLSPEGIERYEVEAAIDAARGRR